MVEDVRTLETGGVVDRRTLFLGLVDVALVAGLVLVGFLNHGGNPVDAPLDALETMTPFVIGWLVVVPLADIYAPRALSSSTTAARVTALAWLAAVNVGLLLRSSPAFEGGVTWPFNLVMTGTGLVVLLTWRIGYAATVGD
ncbi:DUF3054 domain-containing protein [Natribaculum luteum]|uniref:DUF3054 domain-containing protein n=1 Tax=Natribaculum luteum TaxID=1586232 RepID=A0ABD5NXP3_9EURY|nr:DUF3054 domain-containing protein [Natribaculum luteum]